MTKVLVILIVLISSFSFYNYYQLKKYKKSIILLEQQINDKEYLIKKLENNIFIQYESEGVCTDNNIYLINGIGEQHSYSDIINNNKLVIRIKESDCGICLEEQLNIIYNSIKENNITQKVFIFSNIDNYREFLSYINYIKIPEQDSYYLESSISLNIPIDNYNPYIYLYLTGPTLEIKNVFIPILTQKELTINYLSYISNLLK